jgi:hypothetical protein
VVFPVPTIPATPISMPRSYDSGTFGGNGY